MYPTWNNRLAASYRGTSSSAIGGHSSGLAYVSSTTARNSRSGSDSGLPCQTFSSIRASKSSRPRSIGIPPPTVPALAAFEGGNSVVDSSTNSSPFRSAFTNPNASWYRRKTANPMSAIPSLAVGARRWIASVAVTRSNRTPGVGARTMITRSPRPTAARDARAAEARASSSSQTVTGGAGATRSARRASTYPPVEPRRRTETPFSSSSIWRSIARNRGAGRTTFGSRSAVGSGASVIAAARSSGGRKEDTGTCRSASATAAPTRIPRRSRRSQGSAISAATREVLRVHLPHRCNLRRREVRGVRGARVLLDLRGRLRAGDRDGYLGEGEDELERRLGERAVRSDEEGAQGLRGPHLPLDHLAGPVVSDVPGGERRVRSVLPREEAVRERLASDDPHPGPRPPREDPLHPLPSENSGPGLEDPR